MQVETEKIVKALRCCAALCGCKDCPFCDMCEDGTELILAAAERIEQLEKERGQ